MFFSPFQTEATIDLKNSRIALRLGLSRRTGDHADARWKWSIAEPGDSGRGSDASGAAQNEMGWVEATIL